MLMDEYAELKRQFWGRHLWARGYFAASSGNVTDEIIKQYIESHGDSFLPPEGAILVSVTDAPLGDFQSLTKLPPKGGSCLLRNAICYA
jgi:hypothetical protein